MMADEAVETTEGTPAGQAPANRGAQGELVAHHAAPIPGDRIVMGRLDQDTAGQLPAEDAPGQEPDDDFDKDRALATIRKLREGEKAAKAQLKELESLRAELQSHRDAKLSQEERIAKQIETLQTQLADKERREAELTQTLQAERLRNRIVAEAAKLQIVDPDAAYKLLDLSEVERDEDGNATNLGKVLKDLVKAKPYLVAQQSAPAASPTNPAREDRQAAADPVSLLNTRSAVSIWDMGTSEALGGGVHWVEKPGN